jgi:hypothetical protein
VTTITKTADKNSGRGNINNGGTEMTSKHIIAKAQHDIRPTVVYSTAQHSTAAATLLFIGQSRRGFEITPFLWIKGRAPFVVVE